VSVASINGEAIRLIFHAIFGGDAVVLIEAMERKGKSPEQLAFDFRTYHENNPGDVHTSLSAFLAGVTIGFSANA
jgi:hypothetical protein